MDNTDLPAVLLDAPKEPKDLNARRGPPGFSSRESGLSAAVEKWEEFNKETAVPATSKDRQGGSSGCPWSWRQGGGLSNQLQMQGPMA